MHGVRAAAATVALCLALVILKRNQDGQALAANARALDVGGEPRDATWWQGLHELLVSEVAAADEEEGFGLIFYGDSITESWRGTSAMRPAEQYAGNRAAFAQHFETKFNAAALGVSGDQLPHLLWRLAHGEFPDRHPPKLAVLLIGTNDLAWARHQGESRGGGGGDAMAEAVPGVAREVLRAVHFIQARAPATKVLLLGLLPRGDERGLRQPSLFSPAIQEVNMHFEQYASQDGRVEYLDCTASLLVKGGGAIDEAKMPDGLHPAGPGAQALARCLRPVVERLMA